jgi:hypothetical protein
LLDFRGGPGSLGDMDDIDPDLAETVGAGALALAAALAGKPELIAPHLSGIPRSWRGKLKVALDDLDMTLSRIGNG